MEIQLASVMYVMVILVTISVSMLSANKDYDEEDLIKITPGMTNGRTLSAAEQYVSFLENGGQVSDDDDDVNIDDEDVQEQQDEYDYESETMNFLLKHYQSQFEDINSENGKKKLAEHIEEMDFDGDGYVSREELRKWLIAQAEKGATEEALGLSGVETLDLNKDGKLSWDEIFEDLKKLGNIESVNFKKGIEAEKIRFEHADKNKDKLLDDLEYTRYATPEYFTEMANYTILSYISDFDQNNDLKISKEEFLKGFDAKGDIEGHKIEAEKFDKMDKNKDGLLTHDEVSSVALEFTIDSFANKRVQNLFFHADADEDGKLSKLEIITSYPMFTKGKQDEEGDNEYKHDEL